MKKNLINIIITFLLLASITLLIYTYYKSEIVFDSKRRSHYLIYYIILSLGILFFCILLFLKKSVKENVLLTLSSFIILAYVIEGILIFTFNKSLSDIEINKKRRLDRAKVILEKYDINVDTRSKLEFQKDQKKKGTDLSLLITPFRMIQSEGIKNFSSKESNEEPKRFYPLSGLSKTLTVGGAESGKYIVYKSDRYGFYNPDEEWDNKVKIVVIGDSNVHSTSTKWENSWAGKLKKITNKSTLSLGIGNNGPLLELATLKEYAQKLKPEFVIWIYCEDNDLVELVEEMKSRMLSQYLKRDFTQNLMIKQNLVEKNYKIFVNQKVKEKDLTNENEAFSNDNDLENNYLSYIKLSKLRDMLFSNLIDYLKVNNSEENLGNFKKVISEAKEITEDFGGEFYFVYLPATTRYVSTFNNHLKRNDFYRNEILEIIENLNINIIDLWDLHFKDLQDPLSTLYFRMHSHYNKETVEILTKKIVQIIEK